jgi:hypothetical protein
MDTLSKSRQDMEEEKAAKLQWDESKDNFRTSITDPITMIDTNELQEDDDTISVEKYLTFDNPYIISSPEQKYVGDALLTARIHGLFPSSLLSHKCFEEATSSIQTNLPSIIRRTPSNLSEGTVKIWKDNIQAEVKVKRRDMNRQVDGMSEWKQMMNGGYRDTLKTMGMMNKFNKIRDQVSGEFKLNMEQSLAFKIFVNGLYDVLATKEQSENRCMYLGGSGGTGKSRVIHAIVALFERVGCREMLSIGATTGAAAHLINGSTIDSICGLKKHKKSKRDTDVDDSSEKLDNDNSWTSQQFLIIDEVSMLGCHKLAEISKRLSLVKGSQLPFGGLNVMFCGDFHQLAPVQDRSLYTEISLADIAKMPSDAKKQPLITSRRGYLLWQEVIKTTVLLRKNHRATDASFSSFLERLTEGKLNTSDIIQLQERVVGHPRGPDLELTLMISL